MMKVRDVMKTQPRVCSPGHSLAVAGRVMAEVGCGVLPVVSEDDRVVGMVTDRDICIEVCNRDLKASDITVRQVMSETVHGCAAEDDVRIALGIMREQRVRRLPVLTSDAKLEGLISLDDVAVEAKIFDLGAAGPTPQGALLSEVGRTLKAIASHDLPALMHGA